MTGRQNLQNVEISIPEHAIRCYLKRVEGVNLSTATEKEFSKARDSIQKAVYEPDHVHHEEKDMAQVHIRGDAGVIVGVQEEYEGPVYSYNEDDDELFVPTVYPSSNF
jgi:hypothetical protein